jgi:serine/threonine protein kinase
MDRRVCSRDMCMYAGADVLESFVAESVEKVIEKASSTVDSGAGAAKPVDAPAASVNAVALRRQRKQARKARVVSIVERLVSAGQLRVKLVDLGNACWIDRHFTDDVQTRQYRAPEVILRANYGTSADIWSLACTLFELAVGEYLFEPKATGRYSRDEDHLALMIELLGDMPVSLLRAGARSSEFFTTKGAVSSLISQHCV